jgi:serine/threonine protein kinase
MAESCHPPPFIRVAMSDSVSPYQLTLGVPPHLAEWRLPPAWSWGTEGLSGEHRHYQEVVDALGRSLSLVTAPDAAHHAWLEAEARHLAHRSHPSIPTTYHYWVQSREVRRGPGYLRRWIAGETVGARLAREGPDDTPSMLNVLRAAGSTLAYLHDVDCVHGAFGPETVWITPTGRIWLLAWQWVLPHDAIPPGLSPDPRWMSIPPEWRTGGWHPTPASDQWQLAALCFTALLGEPPPALDVPPIRWVRPEVPRNVAEVLDRALQPAPGARHASVAAMLRAVDRVVGTRTMILTGGDGGETHEETEEQRLRWATGDDYEVLAALGSGTFGSVWRVRDLALEREVALKLLHPHITSDRHSVGRFRREARLAAQLAHPAIVPIYDWDSRGELSWYTMELAEGGSVGDLVARAGPRPLAEVHRQIDELLSGLAAAHAIGIVHRDLKPENILIDRYGRWRIGDFGVANVSGDEAGSGTGTPAFAAPEQFLGESQGPAVDLFALSAIVFFTLEGRPPFGSGDAKAILARQLGGEIDLEHMAPEVAEWLRRGLAPVPELRFPDATSMQEAWRRAARAARRRERREEWWRRLIGRGVRPGARGA